MSYKNIIEIDNLNGLEKLTKLQLDNNIICKIQNIDKLVNLTWLDLSFNLIQDIEGLDELTNLQDLSLYSNKITELKNLEKLTKLNVFSIGKNLLRNHEGAVQYLKGINNNLEVLKMAENPFVKQGGGPGGAEDYRLYAIEMLKKLKYLDYELINAQQREAAKQKHNDEVQDKDQNASGPADDSKNAVD
jgi:Leucine-rich repeat (LRR) protein